MARDKEGELAALDREFRELLPRALEDAAAALRALEIMDRRERMLGLHGAESAGDATDRVIELEYIDSDGDRVLVRVGPRAARAIVRELSTRLQEWANTTEGNDNADGE